MQIRYNASLQEHTLSPEICVFVLLLNAHTHGRLLSVVVFLCLRDEAAVMDGDGDGNGVGRREAGGVSRCGCPFSHWV